MSIEPLFWVDGAIGIEAILRAESRPVRTVLVQSNRRDTAIARIQTLARAQGIVVESVPAETIAQHAPGSRHGGVVAAVGARRLVRPDELAAIPCSAVVMLDGVEDPYNLGQAIRALYAAGIDGVVLPKRDWSSSLAKVIRASAGASEFMPTCEVASTEQAAATFRELGLSVICTTRETSVSMRELNLTGGFLLIIGGEQRGISRAVLSSADARISIPYGREFDRSLGTAAAAAVLGFEIQRQRGGKGLD